MACNKEWFQMLVWGSLFLKAASDRLPSLAHIFMEWDLILFRCFDFRKIKKKKMKPRSCMVSPSNAECDFSVGRTLSKVHMAFDEAQRLSVSCCFRITELIPFKSMLQHVHVDVWTIYSGYSQWCSRLPYLMCQYLSAEEMGSPVN